MQTISENKFNKLIITDKINKHRWEIWFDAMPAGYVEKHEKKYKALTLLNTLIIETEKLKDAKQFVAMHRAECLGLEVKWKI